MFPLYSRSRDRGLLFKKIRGPKKTAKNPVSSGSGDVYLASTDSAVHQTQANTNSLLGPGKMLKFDQYPGLHRDHLPDNIEGAPNFRQVEDTRVFGVAQPTVEGIAKVLDQMNAKEEPVLWTNMREEPIVYINGRPLSLRHKDDPFENCPDFPGASAEEVDQIEQRLKQEVLDEVAQNDGRIFLHDESQDGQVVGKWVDVDTASVKTVREVYQDFQSQGYQVDFARVPVTDEKTPETKDIHALVERVTSAPQEAKLIFNCHAGRGRTTTGMVMAQMVDENNTPDALENSQGFIAGETPRVTLSLPAIMSLKQGLPSRLKTDRIVDRTEHIQNLRKGVTENLMKGLSTNDPSKTTKYKKKSRDYLHRYLTLVSLSQYLSEEQMSGLNTSFEDWLWTQPKVGRTLSTLEK